MRFHEYPSILFKILFIVVAIASLPRFVHRQPARAWGLGLIASGPTIGRVATGRQLQLAVLAIDSWRNAGGGALARDVDDGGELANVAQVRLLAPRFLNPFLLGVVRLLVLGRQV